MRPTNTLNLLLALLIAGTGANTLAAQAVSNLGTPDTNGTGIGGDQSWAVPFTTGHQPATLTSVTVRVSNVNPRPYTYALAVWSDVAGQPATPLESLPLQSTGIDPNPIDLTFPSAGLPLAPDTTYWAVLDSPSSVSWYWVHTLLPDQVSSYGWTIGDHAAYEQGTTWYLANTVIVGRLAVDATILPEPASLLAACGLALPLLTRPRRHRPR